MTWRKTYKNMVGATKRENRVQRTASPRSWEASRRPKEFFSDWIRNMKKTISQLPNIPTEATWNRSLPFFFNFLAKQGPPVQLTQTTVSLQTIPQRTGSLDTSGSSKIRKLGFATSGLR